MLGYTKTDFDLNHEAVATHDDRIKPWLFGL